MRKLFATAVVFLLTGCGTALDPTAAARSACSTLTDAEFGLLLNAFQFDSQNGGTKEENLAGVSAACFNNALFDADSACRDCTRAIIEAAFP